MNALANNAPQGNALAALDGLDMATLQHLQGLARPEDQTGGGGGPATLKINYDEESIHGTGVWLIGQKKDGDNITEQGEVVTRMIILTTRLQYSYYDQKTPADSFETDMYCWGGKAEYKNQFDQKLFQVGKTQEDGRFRVVLFGMAILASGDTVECVAYVSGTGYPNIKAHLDMFSAKGVPPYVTVTDLLETDKGKNGSRIYYIPKFGVGEALYTNPQMIETCRDKAEEVANYVDDLNARCEFAPKGGAAGINMGGTTSAPVEPPQQPGINMGGQYSAPETQQQGGINMGGTQQQGGINMGGTQQQQQGGINMGGTQQQQQQGGINMGSPANPNGNINMGMDTSTGAPAEWMDPNSAIPENAIPANNVNQAGVSDGGCSLEDMIQNAIQAG